MTITAQATGEPDDREQALADIADALGRLGHQAEPEDQVAAELARLRTEVAALKATLAVEQHCHSHCWCRHIHWYPTTTFGAAGGYYPYNTVTYNPPGAIGTGGYYYNTAAGTTGATFTIGQS